MEVKYPETQAIIDRLHGQVAGIHGERTWEDITAGALPTGNMENGELSEATRKMLNRFIAVAGDAAADQVMHNVRHALTRESYRWARELFLACQDIDALAEMVWQRQIRALDACLCQGTLFYGQPVTEDVMAFARGCPELFYGRRKGNRIEAMAIPYRLVEYLKAPDMLQRRYCMCHCQFARESILAKETVPASMCYCSMGHTKLFWEAALDMDLRGEVMASALRGDDTCRFAFELPDAAVQKYTRANAGEA